jgi:hypothetical protein
LKKLDFFPFFKITSCTAWMGEEKHSMEESCCKSQLDFQNTLLRYLYKLPQCISATSLLSLVVQVSLIPFEMAVVLFKFDGELILFFVSFYVCWIGLSTWSYFFQVLFHSIFWHGCLSFVENLKIREVEEDILMWQKRDKKNNKNKNKNWDG